MAGNPFGSQAGERDGERQALLRAVQADVARNENVLGRSRLSARTAEALLTVERHLFVPAEFQAHAYENRALPIGQGQTISQPTVVAMMTDLLATAPTDTVLEIGTGSGYQAAILSAVLNQGYVHTIEIVTVLAHDARERLRAVGCDNVRVHVGDGYAGLPALAPFDGIMVTAAAERVPSALLAQLKPGGRLVMPVGTRGETQWLTVIEKTADGKLDRRVVLPVRFVPMTGQAEGR